jgi:hypothetical protein
MSPTGGLLGPISVLGSLGSLTPPLAAAGPSAAWYLTRSTGAVALLLLSASVVLGVVDVRRLSSPRWPRFVIDSLHRNVSLFVLVFLALHILTSVIDSFAPIPLLDSVLPFVGSYRPFWLGLGAVSLDLLLAVTITSVLRSRVGHRTWRAAHWLSYGAWPVALLHGLGTGSDTKSTWMLALTGVCVLAVAAATGWRALAGWPGNGAARGAALAAVAAFVLGVVLWLPGGPLGAGWARRSGTPASLLAPTRAAAATASTPVSSLAPSGSSASANAFDRAFTTAIAGSATQRTGPGGLVAVRLATSFHRGSTGLLDVEIDGRPSGGGGVAMSASRVTLGTRASPALYTGQITSLSGDRVAARITRGDGRSLRLDLTLAIDRAGQTVSGTLTASPVAPGASG